MRKPGEPFAFIGTVRRMPASTPLPPEHKYLFVERTVGVRAACAFAVAAVVDRVRYALWMAGELTVIEVAVLGWMLTIGRTADACEVLAVTIVGRVPEAVAGAPGLLSVFTSSTFIGMPAPVVDVLDVDLAQMNC